MKRRTIEILSSVALYGEPFIPDDWELDHLSRYFIHKTRKIKVVTNGVESEIIPCLSESYVRNVLLPAPEVRHG